MRDKGYLKILNLNYLKYSGSNDFFSIRFTQLDFLSYFKELISWVI